MPPVRIDHPVPPVNLNDRRDQNNHVRADVLDVRSVVDGQTIGQFHQRGGRAGFARMNCARDVVNGIRLVYQWLCLAVIKSDGAWISQLRKPFAIFLHTLQQGRIGNGNRDHLAVLLGMPDREHLHPRRRRFKQTEVLIDIFSIRQHVRRTGHVAQNLGRCWNRR